MSLILYHCTSNPSSLQSSRWYLTDIFNGLCTRWYQPLTTAGTIIQLPSRPSSARSLILTWSLFRQEMAVVTRRPLKLTTDLAVVSVSVKLNKWLYSDGCDSCIKSVRQKAIFKQLFSLDYYRYLTTNACDVNTALGFRIQCDCQLFALQF